MPKIPDSTVLGSPGNFNSGRAVLTAADYDTSAKFKGMARIGEALQGLGGTIAAKEDEDKKKDDTLQLLQADVAHKKALVDIKTGLDEDGDYTTHDQKFTDRAAGATEEAANKISDPKRRALWLERARVQNEGVREPVISQANRLRDMKRTGDLDETLKGYSDLYSNPDTPAEVRQSSLESMEQAVQVGEHTGLLNPKEAMQKRDLIRNARLARLEVQMLNDPKSTYYKLEGRVSAPEGMLQPGTLDTPGKAVRSMAVDIDGQHVLIPTQDADGKQLKLDEARQRFDKTGEHLGVFRTPEAADSYSQTLFENQGRKPKGSVAKALITSRLETGAVGEPLKGVANISKDSGDTKSYGNFGLNSGGSIQAFMKEYGEQLDIEGTPGSAKFDRSWKAFAAADPEALHAAEMAWYEKDILPRINADLVNNGVPQPIAEDDRVQAYFADRMIQYGPNSNKSYSQRISRAAEAANGDTDKFIQLMSRADAANLESDFETALSTVPKTDRDRARYKVGLGNRIQQRGDLSMAGGGTASPDDEYGFLSPLERAAYAAKAKTAIKSQAQEDHGYYSRMLDDQIASVRETGRPVEGYDISGAAQVLTPSRISSHQTDLVKAEAEYTALHDLNTLPDNALTTRLDNLLPVGGEAWYDAKAEIHKKADAQIKKIREERAEDPALAVGTDDAVREAVSIAAQNPDDPGAQQNLVRARMDAQDKLELPPASQEPITVQEARHWASRLKGLRDQSLTDAIPQVLGDIQEMYGPYASAVTQSMVSSITRDRELAKLVTEQMQAVFQGREVSAARTRDVEILQEGVKAAEAFGGPAYGFVGEAGRQMDTRTQPLSSQQRANPNDYFPATQGGNFDGVVKNFVPPPEGAVAKLRANHGLAPDFDAKYGRGAASFILSRPIVQEAQ